MKHIFFTCMFLAATIHAVVIEVNGQADLDAKLSEHPNAVIKFYTPGCPACRLIDADYVRASNVFPDIAFLAINTTKPNNHTVFPKWGVKGVPTFFFVKNGVETEYKRDRNFAASFGRAITEHFAK